MINFAILWPAASEGDDQAREVKEVDRVQLPYLQGLVGGNIEALTLSDRSVMYINEDGKERELRINSAASVLAHEAGVAPWDYIVGPAVIFGPNDDMGGETSITEAMLDRLGLP